MRRVHAVRRGIRPDRLNVGLHTGEIDPMLHDLQRQSWRHILGDRDRLIGRSVPADRRPLCALRSTELHSVVQRLVRGVQRQRQSGQHQRTVGSLAQHRCAVDRDHQRGPIGNQRPTGIIEDQPPHRRRHDRANAEVRTLRLVRRTRHDLHKEQSSNQRREQREYEDSQHDQPKRRLLTHADLASPGGASRRAKTATTGSTSAARARQ